MTQAQYWRMRSSGGCIFIECLRARCMSLGQSCPWKGQIVMHGMLCALPGKYPSPSPFPQVQAELRGVRGGPHECLLSDMIWSVSSALLRDHHNRSALHGVAECLTAIYWEKLTCQASLRCAAGMECGHLRCQHVLARCLHH